MHWLITRSMCTGVAIMLRHMLPGVMSLLKLLRMPWLLSILWLI